MAYNQRPQYGAPHQQYYNDQDQPYDPTYALDYARGAQMEVNDYGAGHERQRPQQYSSSRAPQNDNNMYNYDSWVSDSDRQRQNMYNNGKGGNVNMNDPVPQERNARYGNQRNDNHNGYGNHVDPRNAASPGYGYASDHYHEQDHNSQSAQHNYRHGGGYQEQEAGWHSTHPPEPNERQHFDRHQGPNFREGPSARFNGAPRVETGDSYIHRQNGQPRRPLNDAKSPENLSWDNPFPSFPAKPKGDDHSRRSAERPFGQNQDNRPLTAPSKNGYNSTHEDRRPRGDMDMLRAPQSGSERPPLSRNARSDSDQVHGRGYAGNGHATPYSDPQGNPYALGGPFDEPPNGGWETHRDPHHPSLERSYTMPATVSDPVELGPSSPNGQAWQEPGSTAGYHGPEDTGFLPNGAPGDPRHHPRGPPRAHSDESRNHPRHKISPQPRIPPNSRFTPENSMDAHPNRIRQDPQVSGPPERPNQQFRAPSSDEMPNFNTLHIGKLDHLNGMTVDDHLEAPRSGQPSSRFPPSGPYSERDDLYMQPNIPEPFPRSKSQPDVYERRSPRPQNDPRHNYGDGSHGDRRPATSSSNRRPGPPGRPDLGPSGDKWMNRPLPRPPDQQRPGPGWGPRPGERPAPRAGAVPPFSPGPQGLNASSRMPNGPGQQDQSRRRGPTPQPRAGPTSPPQHPSSNPDALPHHPAPVRPGLNDGSPMHSNSKPPPIRHYSDSQASDSGPPKEQRRQSKPVTYQELDRLRQRVNTKPDDQDSKFTLAKKLVEASTVLVDERTDPRNRTKAREDYIMQASKIVKKLAANNHPEAMFYLGDCYSRGSLGLVTDVKEAFTLYQSAAKANHAQAAYRVAVCCEIGQDEGGGTRKDPVKAMQWYKRAAQLGDTSGMYKLGIIQLKGLLGQPKNPKDAIHWLKQAADRADEENPHALHELGLLYEKPLNLEGVAKDEALSKGFFTQAAKLGYKFSQFRLGCAYEYGLLGCPVDPRQSIAWYSKAAVQEEHQSELALSGWYLTGSDGVLQQSDTEAYLWARKAAQAGLAKAEYAMGYFTEVGIGAPSNIEDAKRWYWRAASQNFPKARERLEDLRKGGAVKQKARVSRSNMRKQSDGECTVM